MTDEEMIRKQVEEIKDKTSYKYVKELFEIYTAAGIQNETVNIPLHKVMQAPIPDYIPVSEAVGIKVLFVMSFYEHRLGQLMDNLPGMRNMIILAVQERGK